MRKSIFIFLLLSFNSFSQTENQKIIDGSVYNDNSYSIEGIHVLNITSNEATITDFDGKFKILVNINDEIVFSGIQFKRVDLSNNNIVIPSVFNVSNATLCTTISNEHGVKISTLEHLMAALFGLGIDNALIEINNEEVPILDGSAKVFIEKLIAAEINTSDHPIKIIKINLNMN